MTQNAHGIANRLRILRKDVHSGSFLLVEGHEEKKLYSIFVDRDACKIEIGHGKPNVQGALAILEGEGFAGLLALVDTDFDALEERAVASPNLLRSDTHDLETMLLASPALDKVLIERGDEDKLRAAGGAAGVREKLLALGAPVGYLRWYNERRGSQLLFKDLEMTSFIHESSLAIDLDALLRELRNRSKALIVVDAEVLQGARALEDPSHDRWHVCCGHDLVRILSVGLRRTWGSNKPSDVEPKRLEESLRLAFSRADLESTRLFAGIVAWEAVSAPYVVLSR